MARWQAATGMEILRVLLLSGDREFASAFASLVRAFGHEVEVHDDEQVAGEAAAVLPPDVVFVDQTTSTTDGSQLCRQVRSAAIRSARFVAVTLDNSSETLAACRAAGFDFRFSKPLVATELERFLSVTKADPT
ncbi:MAG TPA: response regulator [Pirellulales bacterium]|nr:response regulator [Pirellulales bacterium]